MTTLPKLRGEPKGWLPSPGAVPPPRKAACRVPLANRDRGMAAHPAAEVSGRSSETELRPYRVVL
jgi:hypothetical protein